MKPAWFSSENVKWLVGTLAVPAALGVLTYLYNNWAAERAETDSRLRLYTELLSKREEADTGVRRDIFSKLMEKYLAPGQTDLEQRIVVLELLSQNFNESLNLSPLFWQLDRQNAASTSTRIDERKAQLERVAEDIKQRQFDLLDVYGQKGDTTYVSSAADTKPLIDVDLDMALPGAPESKVRVGCHFTIEAFEYNATDRQVVVRVQAFPVADKSRKDIITGPGCGTNSTGATRSPRQWVFSVDPYDFPLVTYTRMSKTERFAVYSSQYQDDRLSLRFVYFPSSLNGVRDKPFIDEVMSELRRSSK